MNLIALRGEDVVRDVIDDDLMATDANRSVVEAMNVLRASLAIPLKISGEVCGLLAVGDKDMATNYSFG